MHIFFVLIHLKRLEHVLFASSPLLEQQTNTRVFLSNLSKMFNLARTECFLIILSVVTISAFEL